MSLITEGELLTESMFFVVYEYSFVLKLIVIVSGHAIAVCLTIFSHFTFEIILISINCDLFGAFL